MTLTRSPAFATGSGAGRTRRPSTHGDPDGRLAVEARPLAVDQVLGVLAPVRRSAPRRRPRPAREGRPRSRAGPRTGREPATTTGSPSLPSGSTVRRITSWFPDRYESNATWTRPSRPIAIDGDHSLAGESPTTIDRLRRSSTGASRMSAWPSSQACQAIQTLPSGPAASTTSALGPGPSVRIRVAGGRAALGVEGPREDLPSAFDVLRPGDDHLRARRRDARPPDVPARPGHVDRLADDLPALEGDELDLVAAPFGDVAREVLGTLA